MNQIDIPDYHYYLDCYAKKNGPPNFPRKKVSFSYGKLQLFQINNFKNRSFLSDQRDVQSEPN